MEIFTQSFCCNMKLMFKQCERKVFKYETDILYGEFYKRLLLISEWLAL